MCVGWFVFWVVIGVCVWVVCGWLFVDCVVVVSCVVGVWCDVDGD